MSELLPIVYYFLLLIVISALCMPACFLIKIIFRRRFGNGHWYLIFAATLLFLSYWGQQEFWKVMLPSFFFGHNETSFSNTVWLTLKIIAGGSAVAVGTSLLLLPFTKRTTN
jgi:hypothetical protein